MYSDVYSKVKFLILDNKAFPKIPLFKETNSKDKDKIKLTKKVIISLRET